MSRVTPPRLNDTFINCGLLATLIGTIGRVAGDCTFLFWVCKGRCPLLFSRLPFRFNSHDHHQCTGRQIDLYRFRERYVLPHDSAGPDWLFLGQSILQAVCLRGTKVVIFPAYIYQTKRVYKIFVFLNTVALQASSVPASELLASS